MDNGNIVPFRPREKLEPTAPESGKPKGVGYITEADLRWMIAATLEFRRLRDQSGPDTEIGGHLQNAYVAAVLATGSIAEIHLGVKL